MLESGEEGGGGRSIVGDGGGGVEAGVEDSPDHVGWLAAHAHDDVDLVGGEVDGDDAVVLVPNVVGSAVGVGEVEGRVVLEEGELAFPEELGEKVALAEMAVV